MAAKDVSQFQVVGPSRASDFRSDVDALARGVGVPGAAQGLAQERLMTIELGLLDDIVSNGSAVFTNYYEPWQDVEILAIQAYKGSYAGDLTGLTLDLLVTKSGSSEASCLPSGAESIFSSQPLIKPDDETSTTPEKDRKYYLQYGDKVRAKLTPTGTGSNITKAAAVRLVMTVRVR